MSVTRVDDPKAKLSPEAQQRLRAEMARGAHEIQDVLTDIFAINRAASADTKVDVNCLSGRSFDMKRAAVKKALVSYMSAVHTEFVSAGFALDEVYRILQAEIAWESTNINGGARDLWIGSDDWFFFFQRLQNPVLAPEPSKVNAQDVNRRKRPPAFPRRAHWFSSQLLARNKMSPDLFKNFGGPDPKTSRRIKRGLSVNEDSLGKVATGLSTAPITSTGTVFSISRADIPND